MSDQNETQKILGQDLSVRLTSGSEEVVTVRTVRVGEYRAAFALYDDELRLVETVCNKPRGWAENLDPDSYERLAVAVREVNGHFFAYCARRLRDSAAAVAALQPGLAVKALAGS